MAVITLSTLIAAPRERVFDLARSIDAHVESTQGTGERAVGGVTTGFIEEGQSVTWEARHFGVKQRLTVRIAQMKRPDFFEDVMVSGAFKRFTHRHEFVERDRGTEMFDTFTFEAPLGLLGRMAERFFLTAYMRQFLKSRAAQLKRLAESEDWRRFV